jgi:hypothetical protein
MNMGYGSPYGGFAHPGMAPGYGMAAMPGYGMGMAWGHGRAPVGYGRGMAWGRGGGFGMRRGGFGRRW